MRMQAVTTTFALVASSAAAETIRCTMDDDSTLRFTIDYSQFSPPVDANDPPRQQRTLVHHDAQQFAATPFRIGDARGFEAMLADGTTTLFVTQADGTAVLSMGATPKRIAGTCTRGEASR